MPEHTMVILGAGYAGLFAARRAARALPSNQRASTRIVLVDREHAWTERTRWHQLAAGEPVAERDLGRLFRGTPVETLTATVAAIDLDARTLRFSDGGVEPLAFDHLVYALGSRSSAGPATGASPTLHTLDTSHSSRAVATALARRPANTVAVVGGGLTGIQTAAQIADRHPALTIGLISSGPVAHELPDPARLYVRRSLERRGVVLSEGRVDSVEESGYTLDGRAMPADLVVWTAGFAPADLGRAAGLDVTELGQVVVDDTLRSVSHPFVYAAGDAAAFARAASPYGAYAATATGATAGRNAMLDALGQEPGDLDLGYAFLGVSLGRHDAAIQLLAPDGSPRERMLTGRIAHALKEGVEHYVSGALRAERRLPGFYHWAPSSR